jgi:hypothetical protein
VHLRRSTAAGVAAALLAAGLAACSSDDTASTSTTEPRPPSPTTTTTTTIVPGSEAPLEPDWAWQSGAPDDDTVEAATGRLDQVVLVGGARRGPAAGEPGTQVVGLASADGAERYRTESPADRSDDVARAVSSGSDGTTVACGSLVSADTSGFLDSSEAWCAPVDPVGALGARTGSGSEGDDEVTGLAMSSGSEFAYLTASTDGLYPGAEDPTGGFLGERDALLIRTDAEGRPRWARQFGTQGDDAANGVAVTADDDAVVAGTTSDEALGFDDGSLRRGGRDAWVARSDPFGNQRWLTPFGTSADDSGRAVAAGGDATRGTETIVAVGSTNGDVRSSSDGAEQLVAPGSAPAAGGSDVLVAAVDAGGRQQWITQLGSAGDDDAAGVVVDGETVYVAGTAGDAIVGSQRVDVPGAADGAATGGRDAFLSAYDLATGTWRWTAVFGSPGDERVTGVALSDDGHVVVVGTTSGTLGATPISGGTDGFAVAFPVGSSGGGGAASSA